jgi:ribosomal protein S18 acetylase RimI-like enzyme
LPPEIRKLNWRSDREAVLGFQKEIYESNFPGFVMTPGFLREYEQQLRNALRATGEYVAVLEDEGQVIGFIWLALIATMVEPLMGYIKNIYLLPEWRGQGFARRLLEEGDRWFQACGCERVALDASVCNERAVGLYQQAGFEAVRYRMEKSYHPKADQAGEAP